MIVMRSSPVSVFDFGSNPTTVRKGESTVRRNRMIQRTKTTLLVTLAATGGMMFSSCGVTALRDSALAGTQAFAQSYVVDLFTAFVPAADTLLAEEDEGDDGA